MSEVWRGLQPLRVAPGWRIDINSLYAVDPSPETIEWFYGSALVSGHRVHDGLCFDTRWEPEGDPEGAYRVDFLRLAGFGRKRRSTREPTPLGTWTTTSRTALVTALEEFMFTGNLPAGHTAPPPLPNDHDELPDVGPAG
ncbi:hypothetical protein [Streptomyces anulatus]|uniref:Uncharacterized protein n=1 Tax=Streptomyces anulatus TaxID=1892 RepID=A0A7K3RL71_STRAQ|nr:hypothetical protein [Streptomyces anulatus]NEC02717.1 hypothetical protein [Streptomyces anulatus]NED29794.1 hypothetical protein [Streptomyces anulatus]